jgi:hypothetical protein
VASGVVGFTSVTDGAITRNLDHGKVVPGLVIGSASVRIRPPALRMVWFSLTRDFWWDEARYLEPHRRHDEIVLSCSLAGDERLCHHEDVTGSTVRYDEIGRNYALVRHADPRISALIDEALGDASSVVNVGAGTGSYEPSDRRVVAVEPSSVMISQRRSIVPVIQAVAELLPFRDGTFDAAMAILTMHHWSDPGKGSTELRRVARRVVVLTIDPEFARSFWLTAEYFPEIGEWDAKHFMSIDEVCRSLGETTTVPVFVPHDCQDGFLAAFWRRPSSYLDPAVRAGISTFAMIDEREREAGLRRLAQDLESGAWTARHQSLRNLDVLDVGYRLIIAA